MTTCKCKGVSTLDTTSNNLHGVVVRISQCSTLITDEIERTGGVYGVIIDIGNIDSLKWDQQPLMA